MKQLFKLKNRNPHPACIIYKEVCVSEYKKACVSEQTYIGETRRNVELRWGKYENTSNDSEPAKHLKESLSNKFSMKILFAAPENKFQDSKSFWYRVKKTNFKRAYWI